jgi:hypothetical protein
MKYYFCLKIIIIKQKKKVLIFNELTIHSDADLEIINIQYN